MRHGFSGKKFGRNQTLRAATLRDLCKAVLTHETIKTTRVKAGEARKLVDRLITMGKKNTLAAKRNAFSILCDHDLVSKLFNVIAPRFVSRHGGYTRIIKFAVNRQGDNAEMALLELTEKAPEVVKDAKDAKVEDAKLVDGKGEAKPASKAKKAPAKKTAAAKEPKAAKPKKASAKA
jgi:large subunit ribosomal protein L17